MPEPDKGTPKKLIDYSVMKKGLKQASRKTKPQQDQIENAYRQEEEKMEEDRKEEARLAKIEENKKKN